MYAVIRAGGKQYKVAPGDVIRVETVDGANGPVQFNDVLAVSAESGSVVRPDSGAQVTGEVVEQGRKSHRLPLQAQEAVQKTPRPPPELQRRPHHRDRLRRPIFQSARPSEEREEGKEGAGEPRGIARGKSFRSEIGEEEGSQEGARKEIGVKKEVALKADG
jgi:ribosomal protein L21